MYADELLNSIMFETHAECVVDGHHGCYAIQTLAQLVQKTPAWHADPELVARLAKGPDAYEDEESYEADAERLIDEVYVQDRDTRWVLTYGESGDIFAMPAEFLRSLIIKAVIAQAARVAAWLEGREPRGLTISPEWVQKHAEAVAELIADE